MPTPPEGEGRMLDWYRHSQRNAIIAGGAKTNGTVHSAFGIPRPEGWNG